ncbi:Uncharacterized protein conserved in bacteria [Raoultella planticola]|uniref:Uncharacterized protein conserved in bacteria n=1 Tax=Raoultella planticola TaxID=575 RepID=A0A485BJM4_RAOPL|nr:Uncharacterized protein conserved in bacteria [Raoultella planticola]
MAVLSVGYSYPNLIMAEDYNAPGSPLLGPENHAGSGDG